MEYNIPQTCTNRSQRQNGKMLGTEVIKWILYADDVVLFCKSVNEAKQILNIINDTCNSFGLTISFKKTKTQVFNNAELAKRALLFNIQGNARSKKISSKIYKGRKMMYMCIINTPHTLLLSIWFELEIF